ncbi:minor capsid protein [Ruminococcus callidus]|uniref:minor capsid protein n=1 Tax=Ruminococcus TaxID=1263 RepID=UPI0026EAB36D|nr:minor capsid protein [Ruminococcus callidus]MBS4832338.1 minor capsid protein [Ruminococcus callidus]
MQGKSSPVYWHDRKVQYDASLAKDEKRLYSKLAAYYEKEAARLDKEIAAYYAKYSVNGVLSYRNLLETLPDADKRLLIEQLDEFVKKYPDYADLVPVRESIYKLNRLEGLRQSIAMQQLHMGAYEQQQALSFFQRQALRYANGAASFLGLGSGFYRLDSDVIRAAVGNKWCDGKDFSERIWNNRTKLGNTLHTQFVNGVIRGDDYHQLARQLREKFTQVSQKNAERLTFTEDTYLSNEAAMQVFEREASVTEYEYVCTGDAETCDICRGLSGERFKIAERVPGLNFPPMHPWCRCFFDPVIPEKKTLTSGVDGGIIRDERVVTAVESGEISLNLNPEKQNPHIYGSSAYDEKEHKSYFTVTIEELQEIVNRYYGTGKIMIKPNGQIKEILEIDEEIGEVLKSDGTPIGKTNRITVHYSKKRTHVVPAKKVQTEQ